MRSRRRSGPPPRKTQTVFDPTTVAEIAAGYFWDPASASGLGAVGFKIPEGNGHSTFDLVQATVAKQPTALSQNGAVQYRMRKTGNANPSFIGSAGNVAAGWTGPTYVGGWFRLPDAAGVVTNAGTLFAHTLSAGDQRRIIIQNIATVGQRVVFTGDGGAGVIPNNDFANIFAGDWVWVEILFDGSQSTPTDRAQLWFNFARRALGGSPSDFTSGTMPTSVFDATAPLFVGCRSAVSANADTTDFGPVYYGNGIPSLANRKRLRNRHRPVAGAA